MKLVHYMLRRPDCLGEVMYPSDLTDDSYQGYGSFFLDGMHLDDLEDNYVFYAVRNDEILPVKLQRVGLSVYRANVAGIGCFIFTATRVGVPAHYTGQFPFPSHGQLVRQLSPKNRLALEAAALKHNFYFAGYSPKIETETPARAPDPEPSPDRWSFQ